MHELRLHPVRAVVAKLTPDFTLGVPECEQALAWPSGESRVKRRDFAQTFDVTDKLARGLLSLLAGEIAQPTAAQLDLESEAAAKNLQPCRRQPSRTARSWLRS